MRRVKQRFFFSRYNIRFETYRTVYNNIPKSYYCKYHEENKTCRLNTFSPCEKFQIAHTVPVNDADCSPGGKIFEKKKKMFL